MNFICVRIDKSQIFVAATQADSELVVEAASCAFHRAATIIRPLLVLNYGYFEPHQADGNETLKVRFFYIDRPGFNSILVGKFVVLSNS